MSTPGRQFVWFKVKEASGFSFIEGANLPPRMDIAIVKERRRRRGEERRGEERRERGVVVEK